jgi:hypothetical protein
MHINEPVVNIVGIFIFLLVFVTLASPKFIWSLKKPFLYTNRMQWLFLSPLRKWLRDPASSWPRRWFLVGYPIFVIYSLCAYIFLLPLRLVNAFYFDILLFWSVCLRDGLLALVFPYYYERKWTRKIYLWVYYFPKRLVQFIGRYLLVLMQGLATFCFDLVWPTLTLFHGTDKTKAEKIAATGEWLAGAGDYAGTGIYFGLEQEVAQHYIRSKADSLIVVSRVTLTPCRSISTLPEKIRAQIGSDGDAISRSLPFPWVSLEHWRKDMHWYEFCFVQKTKYNVVSPWRIRPICVVGKEAPERLIRGITSWPKNTPGYNVLAGTLLSMLIPYFLISLSPYKSSPGDTIVLQSAPGIRLLQPSSIYKIATSVLNSISTAPGQTLLCPGAPPIRQEVGISACIADIRPETLRIRSSPGIDDDNVIFRLNSGSRLLIIDGPVCADGFNWFKVFTMDGLEGWAAEGSKQLYFMESCH